MIDKNTNESKLCIVCKEQQVETLEKSSDQQHLNCRRCGEYKVSGTAAEILGRRLDRNKRALLSGWVHEKFRAGEIPFLTTMNLELILATPVPSITERANNLLIEAAINQNQLDIRFDPNEPRFMAATYSAVRSDLIILMNLLENIGLIEHRTLDGSAHISPQGLIHLYESSRKLASSSQGFVAMSFNRNLVEAYSNGLEVGILQAGYRPVRVDQVEHINRIDDEIIAQIKASRFVVADFTDHRGGVYFEAGFAMGLDKPIFWTCRQDDMRDLHFDIRQFNCIDWGSPEELARRLSMRIEAVVGPGPNKLIGG